MILQTPILDSHFDHWMRSVFGPDWRTKLPEIEQTERQRAFFSGFASFYFFSIEYAALPDAAAMARLAAVHEEIKSYFDQMKRVPKAGPNSN